MNSAPAATQPPPVTAAEKAAVLAVAFVLGVLLAIPTTRGMAIDAMVSVGRFLGDTTLSVLHVLGSLVGLA